MPPCIGLSRRNSFQRASESGVPQSWPRRRARSKMISRSSRTPSGGGTVRRTRCTLRSLEVTVPSVSKAPAAAGSTTSASAAALDIILSTQRIHPAAVATDVPGENGKVDERDHIVHGVVVFSDAQRPAKLGARSFGVGMSHSANGLGRYAGLAFSALQCVFLD